MTCRECRDLMLEVARDRAASFVERSVLAHTSSCPACSRDLERQRAVSAGLRAVALQQANTKASAGLESRLIEAFAALHAHAGAGPSGRTVSTAGVKRWLPFAAAVALCAAGVTWWLTRSASATIPPPPTIAKVQEQQPLSPIQPEAIAQADRVAPAHERRPARRGSRRAAGAPVQAVGFVPIPSAAGLPAFESGQIVRLGIPVTAFPNYGLEIPAGPESSIQADLLVGQDGQPRAIRLVNSVSQDLHPRR